MDKPANFNVLEGLLIANNEAEKKLIKERHDLNARVFAESGLAKGDTISLRDSYYGDITAEVMDVFLVLRHAYGDEPACVLIKVRGYKLTKQGKRHLTLRPVSCYLENCALVSKAVQP
jgi:hypothetical protein